MGMNECLSSLLGHSIKSEERNTAYTFNHNASKAMCNEDDRPALGLHNIAIRSQLTRSVTVQTTLVNRLSKLRSDTKF